MDEKIGFFDRLTAAAAYLLFFPALYIILTEKRKKEYLALHGCQALFYWLLSFFILVAIRIGVDCVMTRVYIRPLELVLPLTMWAIWLYCIYCSLLALLGRQINIPMISSLTKKAI